MRYLANIKRVVSACAMGAAFLSTSAFAGFSVSGTQLLDGNGQPFVMRGVNHAHTWFTSQTNSAMPNIAATGANTVRVVLSNGQTWTKNSSSEVRNIINLCKQNKLVCVLEVHDATGVGDTGGHSSNNGTISGAADYWVELASVLRGEEDYVIINIANEPVGNGVPVSKWVGDHQDAIRKLRNAGLEHTLIVDAANWGQDWEEIMLSNASQVASADSLNNTMFSVHMYEVYQDYNKINSYLTRFLSNHNLPIIVGEFGDNHQGASVDADSIMEIAEQLDIGYLGWSWSGNGSCCVELDIVNNWNPNSLSPWGQRLMNSQNGIKATSELASIYTGNVSSSSSSSVVSSSSSSSVSSVSSSSSSESSVVSSSSSSESSSGNTAGSLGWFSLLLLVGFAAVRRRFGS